MSRVIWNTESGFAYQGMNNDMVLLKLKSALSFNENVQAACMPDSNWNPGSNHHCFVSGWGTLNSGYNFYTLTIKKPTAQFPQKNLNSLSKTGHKFSFKKKTLIFEFTI